MADAFKLAVLARQSHNVTPPAGFQMLLLLCTGRESQGIQRILSNTKESNRTQGILANPSNKKQAWQACSSADRLRPKSDVLDVWQPAPKYATCLVHGAPKADAKFIPKKLEAVEK